MTSKTAQPTTVSEPQSPTKPMLWTEMTPDVFDTAYQPVQGSLFAAPDPMGTPDLFSDLDDPS